MKRAGIIAAVACGVVVFAGVATWFAAFRDTADPVTVDEAVTSFRTDTEPTPSEPSPIPPGVYVYATKGFEKTDALTGITHRYPRRSTITVAASDCGVRLTWRALKGRSTTWLYCVNDDGWELRSQDERHTFFGHTERTTYVCEDTPIRPAMSSVGMRWGVSCATDGSSEHGVATELAGALAQVAGSSVATRHVRMTTTFSGAIRGTSRYDFWFHEQLGVPVKITLASRTTNDSPIGDVHYAELVALRLTSLEPRR